jgi:Protein of unknown function (DUF2934)
MDTYKIPDGESVKASVNSAREDLIRKRAYELYQARNEDAGGAIQDWLQAEAEVTWKLTH